MPKSSPTKPMASASPKKSDGLKYCWQWRDEHGQWRLYAEEYRQSLESVYSKNHSGSCKMTLGKFEYHIKFDAMQQVNTSTNSTRPIRRIGLSQDEFDLAVAIENSLQLS